MCFLVCYGVRRSTHASSVFNLRCTVLFSALQCCTFPLLLYLALYSALYYPIHYTTGTYPRSIYLPTEYVPIYSYRLLTYLPLTCTTCPRPHFSNSNSQLPTSTTSSPSSPSSSSSSSSCSSSPSQYTSTFLPSNQQLPFNSNIPFIFKSPLYHVAGEHFTIPS